MFTQLDEPGGNECIWIDECFQVIIFVKCVLIAAAFFVVNAIVHVDTLMR